MIFLRICYLGKASLGFVLNKKIPKCQEAILVGAGQRGEKKRIFHHEKIKIYYYHSVTYL